MCKLRGTTFPCGAHGWEHKICSKMSDTREQIRLLVLNGYTPDWAGSGLNTCEDVKRNLVDINLPCLTTCLSCDIKARYALELEPDRREEEDDNETLKNVSEGPTISDSVEGIRKNDNPTAESSTISRGNDGFADEKGAFHNVVEDPGEVVRESTTSIEQLESLLSTQELFIHVLNVMTSEERNLYFKQFRFPGYYTVVDTSVPSIRPADKEEAMKIQRLIDNTHVGNTLTLLHPLDYEIEPSHYIRKDGNAAEFW